MPATRPGRVGVFGIGLAAYWPQFPGLKERLEGYQREVEARLAAMGADVVSVGLVDTAPAAAKAPPKPVDPLASIPADAPSRSREH